MANKSVGLLTIAFGADLRGFDRAMKQAQRKISKFGKNMQRVGRDLSIGVTAPIIGAGVAAIKFASDTEESINKVDVAFGNASGQVKEFANTTLTAFGIAKQDALEMTALFGDMGTSLGFTQEDAAGMSQQLVGLAGDLSSFKNIDVATSQKALQGIFTGQTRSLQDLGINITKNALENSKYFISLNKNFSALTLQEKIMVRYNAVLEQTQNATGDFVRTQESFANQSRILQGQFKELAAEFGEIMLPTITALIIKIREAVSWFSGFSTETKKTIITVAGVLAVLGPMLIVVGKLTTGFVAIVPAIMAVGKAMLFLAANPVGIVITAVGALIGGFVWLIKSSSDTAMKVRNFFITMANGIIISINKAIDAINFLNPFEQVKHFKLFKLEAKKELEEVGKEAQKASDKVGEIAKNLPAASFDPTQVDMGEDSGGGATEDPLDAKKKEFQEQVTLYKNMLQESINADKENYLKGIIQKEDYLSRVKDAEENHLLLMKDLYAAYGEHILDIDRQILDGKIANMEEETTTTMNLKDALISAGESVANQMAQGAENMGAFAELAKGAIKDVIGGLIAQGVAAAVTSAMTSTAATGQVWLIPIVAKIASGLAKTAFNSLLPSFAEGGIVSKPMIAQVGDAPSGPEVIAPLDKLKSMMGDTKQEVEVVGRIAGDDIWLSNKKTGFNRFRSV